MITANFPKVSKKYDFKQEDFIESSFDLSSIGPELNPWDTYFPYAFLRNFIRPSAHCVERFYFGTRTGEVTGLWFNYCAYNTKWKKECPKGVNKNTFRKLICQGIENEILSGRLAGVKLGKDRKGYYVEGLAFDPQCLRFFEEYKAFVLGSPKFNLSNGALKHSKILASLGDVTVVHEKLCKHLSYAGYMVVFLKVCTDVFNDSYPSMGFLKASFTCTVAVQKGVDADKALLPVFFQYLKKRCTYVGGQYPSLEEIEKFFSAKRFNELLTLACQFSPSFQAVKKVRGRRGVKFVGLRVLPEDEWE